MITRPAFHQLWSPIVIMFQLFGYATFMPNPYSIARHRLLIYPITILLGTIMLGLYTICTKISIIGEVDVQLNVVCDQTVFVTVLITHLTALLESLLRHRQTEQFYDLLYNIGERLSAAEQSIRFESLYRRELVRNWLQLFGLGGLMALGIGLTGLESWLYLRWIMPAMMSVNVRLIEVSMHVEFLGETMHGLEKLLATLSANTTTISNDRDAAAVDWQHYKRLHDATEIYGLIHRLAVAISHQYGGSMLAFALCALTAMTSTSFWALNKLYTGIIDR